MLCHTHVLISRLWRGMDVVGTGCRDDGEAQSSLSGPLIQTFSSCQCEIKISSGCLFRVGSRNAQQMIPEKCQKKLTWDCCCFYLGRTLLDLINCYHYN